MQILGEYLHIFARYEVSMIKAITRTAVHRQHRRRWCQWHMLDKAWLHRLITKWAKKSDLLLTRSYKVLFLLLTNKLWPVLLWHPQWPLQQTRNHGEVSYLHWWLPKVKNNLCIRWKHYCLSFPGHNQLTSVCKYIVSSYIKWLCGFGELLVDIR